MQHTVSTIVENLCEYRQVCAKAAIIGNMLQMQNDFPCGQYNYTALKQQHTQLLHKKSIIDCWLQLLPDDERFVIQTHMIQGLDWAKTQTEYDKVWGIMNGRSERTLKRMQAKAIRRIAACMNQIEALACSTDVEVK